MPTFLGLLKEAAALQQRAERRRGADAFTSAAGAYRAALALARSSSPAAADVAACLFGLAECLLQGAEAVLAACAQLPDQTLSVAAVQQADGQAVALLEESVGAFGRVREPDGQPRVDALVCGGNALRYGGLWIKVGVPPGPSLPAAFDSNHPRPAHPCRCMRQLLG